MKIASNLRYGVECVEKKWYKILKSALPREELISILTKYGKLRDKVDKKSEKIELLKELATGGLIHLVKLPKARP